MTTNTNTPPTKTAEQRLAESYGPLPDSERDSTHTPPSLPLTAEQRLAQAYERDTPNADADANESNDAGEASPPKADDKEAPPTRYVIEDPETQSALSGVARDLKLDDKAVQQLVDKMGPVLDARATQRVRDMAAGWERDARADPEIGGARLDETLRFAKKAVALGTPALRELLDGGLGNHPEIVRWAAAIGRRLAAAERAPSNLPPKSSEEKLAGTYTREPSPRPSPPVVRRTPQSAEERLAAGYRTR